MGIAHRAGAVGVGGSDWPVSSADPLQVIEVMVRRQDPSAGQGPVLGRDEELTLPTALAAYTTAAARLLGHGAEVGTLKKGALAGLVVLDRPMDGTTPTSISDAHPLLTVVGGAVVFRAPPAAPGP